MDPLATTSTMSPTLFPCCQRYPSMCHFEFPCSSFPACFSGGLKRTCIVGGMRQVDFCPSA